MNIGLTLFKRRCKELSINHWPHRKIKSLHLLVQNLKETGLDNKSWSVGARNKDVGESSRNGTHIRDKETKASLF
ncbi:hypothetical protein HN873_004594 [Arachis hypogaea]